MTLVVSLTVFVLASFVGFEVITKVPPTLHTTGFAWPMGTLRAGCMRPRSVRHS